MVIFEKKDLCVGCFACYNICPKNCIKMIPDQEGFLYPKIEENLCVGCGLCESVCPNINIKKDANNHDLGCAYAATNKNEDICLESSSGGIFTLLAEEVILGGGIVFGAAFSKDFKSVEHIAVENAEELWKLRGSKYVQSSIGDAYKFAKKYLDENRRVLFSGTPCQIAGLYKYLGKIHENLITCDFICHGVPSSLIWKKYLELREEYVHSKVQNVSFRYKKDGWRNSVFLLQFKDGKEFAQTKSKDLYYRGFINNVFLRPSCYKCNFKGLKRVADITMADFWGVEKVAPEMNNSKGTSLVIANSNVGKEIFECIKEKMSFCPVSIENAVKYNLSAVRSSVCPQKIRMYFFENLDKMSFANLLKKYCAAKPKEKVKKAVGKVFKKVLILWRVVNVLFLW